MIGTRIIHFDTRGTEDYKPHFFVRFLFLLLLKQPQCNSIYFDISFKARESSKFQRWFSEVWTLKYWYSKLESKLSHLHRTTEFNLFYTAFQSSKYLIWNEIQNLTKSTEIQFCPPDQFRVCFTNSVLWPEIAWTWQKKLLCCSVSDTAMVTGSYWLQVCWIKRWSGCGYPVTAYILNLYISTPQLWSASWYRYPSCGPCFWVGLGVTVWLKS